MRVRVIVKVDGAPTKGIVDVEADAALLALGPQGLAESLAAQLPSVAYERHVARVERSEPSED